MPVASPESRVPIPAVTGKQPVLVVGAGSWGTALALVLAKNKIPVYLWDADKAHINNLIRDSGNNRHLAGFPFPENITPVTDLMPLPDNVEDLVIVVPCEALKEVLTRLKAGNAGKFNLCLACKGLEPTTLSLNHEVVKNILGDVPVAVLSGPSFAKEVAAGLPTAVTIASSDPEAAARFSDRFHSETFRIYTHDDVVGVQIGGAVKNVMAIAAGIADGLGFGANTRSALITRGLAEIMRLGIAMGGRQETFMGLAGLGDLVLTCTDDQSRNRRFGLALAHGKPPDEARRDIAQAIEGIRTAGVVIKLAERYGIDMPISRHVQLVIDGKLNPRDAVSALLARERKAEKD